MNRYFLMISFLVFNNFLFLDAKFYSQYSQDKFVYETFFKNKKDGIFIDIGAHDGISLSNSFFFERELGWTGICIEPIPSVFEQLEKNRSCICINACIAEHNGQEKFLVISGYPEMLSGLASKYDPRHLERIKKELKQYGGSYEAILVDCFNLNDLLRKYNICHVDYLSIDIEGGELDILKSINFDEFDIHIIDVENNYHDATFSQFLLSKGYTFIKRLGADEIYQKLPK